MKNKNIDKEITTLSLEELCSRYDGFMLDAYGVFWESNATGTFRGAAEAMAYLVAQGKHVGIVSNSTQLARKEKDKLHRHGLYEGVHYHFFLTSGEVARTFLQQETLPFPTPRHTYWLFGSIHPHFGSHIPLFEGTTYREVQALEDADFIYLPVPHIGGMDQEDPEHFREQVQATANHIPVLCVNPDRFAMEGAPPRLVVRQGSIADMFVKKGVPVYFIGKPSKVIYEFALGQFPKQMKKESIVMIGDTPETDIRGAHGIGLAAALMVKTGVMSTLLEKDKEGVLDKLPPSDKPDFLLNRLILSI